MDDRTERTVDTTHLTSEMVRVLAHPMRARLLGLLRTEGSATASALAARVGTNSGATSYHLRQLAEVGLVDEDVSRGNKRDRWWRATHRSHSWRESEHDTDPEARSAADWLTRYAHREYGRRVEAWHDDRAEWPVAWRDASDQSDMAVHVNPAQLSELARRVHALVAEYRTAADPDDETAEPVTVLFYAFPQQRIGA